MIAWLEKALSEWVLWVGFWAWIAMVIIGACIIVGILISRRRVRRAYLAGRYDAENEKAGS